MSPTTSTTPFAKRVRASALTHPPRPYHAPIRIALLGCGTIGREVARVLLEEGLSRGLELVSVLVRDPARPRGLPDRLHSLAHCKALFTSDLNDVLRAKPDLAIEVLGGLGASVDIVRSLLGSRIHVVSANKTLIAHHARELRALAASRRVRLRHEAAVAAGVPLFAALHQLRGDRVTRLRGVINGSCNYILTRMERTGESLQQAVHAATAEGLVEPDPSADLSGRDSAEKLCVLAGELGIHLHPRDVRTTGIEALEPNDLRAAAREGRAIRLIAELSVQSSPTDESTPRLQPSACIHASVSPVLIPRSHALAKLTGAENAVEIEAELAGTLVLRGLGAGPKPTTSAILGDVHAIASGIRHSRDPQQADDATDTEPHPLTEPEPTDRHALSRSHGPTSATTPLHIRCRSESDPLALLDALRRDGLEPLEIAFDGPIARILTKAPDTPNAATHHWPALQQLTGDRTLLVIPAWNARTPRAASA